MTTNTAAEGELRGTPLAEPGPRARCARALGVAVVWLLAVLPVAMGRADCPVAEVFGVPCPGCGMTRAVVLFAAGRFSESFAMHPFALPSGASSLALMALTVVATAKTGLPTEVWAMRTGRAVVVAFAAVQLAVLLLWALRELGAFGGPVPV